MNYSIFGLLALLVSVFNFYILWKQRYREPLQAPASCGLLQGYRVGIALLAADDMLHEYQRYIERYFISSGAALFTLSPGLAESLLARREWTEADISGNSLDIIIVGQVLRRESLEERSIVPTHQHLHTPSGQGFHELTLWHPDYRPANAWRTRDDGIREPYWCEPMDHFQERCRQESYVECVRRQQDLVDILILGSGGRVYGSNHHVYEVDTDSLRNQVKLQPLQQVLAGLSSTMTAHRYTDATAELAQIG
jgi:hypothetical protein